ncbi:MAG: T9SS type A sorting domain-containing protein [Pedobacter sp.]|uniref:T9SS type A sorting domain-containing protein n=1 Tax=Pedobacter sp. TaxID=1411316 RepID=UPI002809170A|nr:T9SS type A sorting domain-containing protein [Pedobacter sp.]MDQ8004812.1 T9SS type A sorting domain-containing protein [Pedobacter sp.]
MKRLLLLVITCFLAETSFAQTQPLVFTHVKTSKATITGSSTMNAAHNNSINAYGFVNGNYGKKIVATDVSMFSSITGKTYTTQTSNAGVYGNIPFFTVTPTDLSFTKHVAITHDYTVGNGNATADIGIVKNGNYEFLVTSNSSSYEGSPAQANRGSVSYISTSANMSTGGWNPTGISKSNVIALPSNILNNWYHNGTAQYTEVRNFGKKISTSGNRLAVSGQLYSSNNQVSTGFVAIYELNTSGNFEWKHTLTTSSRAENFGKNIYIDGDDILIATEEVFGVTPSPFVYRYKYFNLQFRFLQRLTPPTDYAATLDHGSSLLIANDLLVIGDPSATKTGSKKGATYIYTRETTTENSSPDGGIGTQKDVRPNLDITLTNADFSTVDNSSLGSALAFKDGLLAIGNKDYNTSGKPSKMGGVQFFRRTGNTFNFNYTTTLTANEQVIDGGFGYGLAFSPTLNQLFVGKQTFASNFTPNAGAIEYFTYTETTLPVTLTSYTATNIHNKAVINWKTNTETHNSHFVLERSTDGVNFTEIARITAKGNNSEYTFTDHTPALGANYYKLTQFDFNGDSEMLGVKPVAIKNLNTAEISIYPNPVTDVLNISSNGEKLVSIAIYSTSGVRVKNIKLNNETATSINVQDLTKGIYIVKVDGIISQRSFKIIK